MTRASGMPAKAISVVRVASLSQATCAARHSPARIRRASIRYGKLRGSSRVAATASRAEVEAAALEAPEFVKIAAGREPKKVVVVPGRLVNVVV